MKEEIGLRRIKYAQLNQEADNLVIKKNLLLENLDITGGETGMRNNNRAMNQIKDIDRRLNRIRKNMLSV